MSDWILHGKWELTCEDGTVFEMNWWSHTRDPVKTKAAEQATRKAANRKAEKHGGIRTLFQQPKVV